MGSPERVAVVGAGAVGLTTAYDLATRGTQVTLFERDKPGAGMTDRAAGICYDAYAEDIDVSVSDRAMERFRSLSGDGDFVFHETPYVFLAREGDDSAATALTESVDRMRVHDRNVSLVDADELGEQFPIRTDDITLAGVAENAGWADPAAYVDLFVEKCERAGVEFRVGNEVAVRVEPPTVVVTDELSARFDAVVVAAGIDSRRLLADAGYPLALKPYRAQALVGDCDYRGPIVYDATDGSYLRPHPAGILAGDGVEAVEADSDDWDPTADDWFVENVIDTARHRTETEPTVTRSWAGLCGSTPDNNPLVGAVADGVYVATGWHGHGFMWAPAMGESLAEAVLGNGCGSIPTAFDPTRFDGDESFVVVEGMTLDGDGCDGDDDNDSGDSDNSGDRDNSDRDSSDSDNSGDGA